MLEVLPLSPVRPWASRARGTVAVSGVMAWGAGWSRWGRIVSQQAPVFLDPGPGHEPRFAGQAGRDGAAHAAAAGRAAGVQGQHLAGQLFGLAALAGAGGHA